MSVQFGAWHIAGSQQVMRRAVGLFFFLLVILPGLPWWLSGKESICRRPGFHPWVEKIPWRKKWQCTPVFLSGKSSHGQRSPARVATRLATQQQQQQFICHLNSNEFKSSLDFFQYLFSKLKHRYKLSFQT